MIVQPFYSTNQELLPHQRHLAAAAGAHARHRAGHGGLLGLRPDAGVPRGDAGGAAGGAGGHQAGDHGRDAAGGQAAGQALGGGPEEVPGVEQEVRHLLTLN